MSPDFLRFLTSFNRARKAAGIAEATDWFQFSVPGMFDKATEKEAWHYWRWRTLRARVEPAADYRLLKRLSGYFGQGKVFAKTSNCDQLHLQAGLDASNIYEIHGSLGSLQCAKPCCAKLWPADDAFRGRLEREPKDACLRPNVMVFGDTDTLVPAQYNAQLENFERFEYKFKLPGGGAAGPRTRNWIVLEIGAGVVVPSIRSYAEMHGSQGGCLLRVNPSQAECDERQTEKKIEAYVPLVARSNIALAAIVDGLGLG